MAMPEQADQNGRVPAKVAVLGAGSWGTTFAKVLADAGTDVTLWARRTEVAEEINSTRVNAGYLPGIVLDRKSVV